MVLTVLMLLIFVSVALFQMVQGFLSAFIMLVLTMCCAAFAIGNYETIAIDHAIGTLDVNYAFGATLGLLFGVPLIVLRILFDKLIPRAALLPSVLDKGGAAACGVFTGLIVSGMLTLTLMYIPWDGSTLGYRVLPAIMDDPDEAAGELVPPEPDIAEKRIFFRPAEFTTSMAGMLSDGVFQGTNSFRDENPDLVQAVSWLAMTTSETSRYAPPDAIEITGVGKTDRVHLIAESRGRYTTEGHGYTPEEKPSGMEYIVARVRFKDSAKDHNKSTLFSITHFRVVGKKGDSGETSHHRAVAILADDDAGLAKHYQRYTMRGNKWPVWDRVFKPINLDDPQTEVVFAVPTGFVPQYVEFKRGARIAWPSDDTAPKIETLPPLEIAAAGDDPSIRRRPSVEPEQRGGNVRGATAIRGASIFGDTLPIPLKNYDKLRESTEVGGKIESGHFSAIVSEQEAGTMAEISGFKVPSDKRLLQLSVRTLKAGSTLGKALGQAVKSVQNFKVKDDKGIEHKIIGKYAVADVEGAMMLELQYYPEQIGSVGGLGQFTKIQERHLVGEYELVFLFLVDPGVRIVSFTTGGAATRADDLTTENLVAPE